MINTSYGLPSPEPRKVNPRGYWIAWSPGLLVRGANVNETHSKKALDVSNSISVVQVFVVYKMWQDSCFSKLPWVLTTQ